ncbi:MAG TPA: hypothetical protein DCZ62_05790 [Ruminococcus sp.]|nr:hypothetical protein [Ruminococcus sp.]HBB19935.1 hypothetical protein [Ruminococcus sp.]
MEKTKNSRLLDRLYGGIRMSWLKVIILAVVCAVITAVFLLVPVFENTSFERMGVHLEAWFVPAVFIMANCKKPLESALKTFVFFLVSQPLIYLIQVPFSDMGWGLFGYYKYWAMITLLTFPMAFVGWYITKKNWLSVLILAPVLAFLGMIAQQCGSHALRHFPLLSVAALLCIVQILVYIAAFFPNIKAKILGIIIAVAAAAAMAIFTQPFDVNGMMFLPDDAVLTENAVVEMEGSSGTEVTIESTGPDSMIRIHSTVIGETDFVIRDGDKEYRYTVKTYEDDGGHSQIEITAR